MSDGFDPVQFGRMVECMERLSIQLEAFDRRLGEMEDRWLMGKTAVVVVVFTLGCAVYGVKEMISHALGFR